MEEDRDDSHSVLVVALDSMVGKDCHIRSQGLEVPDHYRSRKVMVKVDSILQAAKAVEPIPLVVKVADPILPDDLPLAAVVLPLMLEGIRVANWAVFANLSSIALYDHPSQVPDRVTLNGATVGQVNGDPSYRLKLLPWLQRHL
jgi:hypothetical protein